MERPQITIHDALTGETVLRDMTDEEIAQLPVAQEETTE